MSGTSEKGPIRAPNLTAAEVEEAAEQLRLDGRKITERNVYAILKRGSISTIQKFLREYTRKTNPPVPELALRPATAEQIMAFGKQIYDLAKSDLDEVVAQREAALVIRAERAEADAIEANQHAEERIAAELTLREAAEAARDAARSNAAAAEAAARQAETAAQQLQGQMRQLKSDRDNALAALATSEENLTAAETRLAGETELRMRSDQRVVELITQLEVAHKDQKSAEQIHAAEVARLKTTIAALQTDLTNAAANTAQIQATLAATEAQLQAAIAKAEFLTAELKGVEDTNKKLLAEIQVVAARNDALIAALTESNRHADALASLKGAIETVTRESKPVPAVPQKKPNE